MKSRVTGAAKNILKILLLAGAVAVTARSPLFGRILLRKLENESRPQKSPKDRARYYNAFYYLKKKGMIHVEYRGQQMYISLTKQGAKRAGKYKIDDLKIKKSNVWDKKWRILIFDIADKQRIKREALRGKIKELGLFQLQKSVWVSPYDFKKEMAILRDFFGLANSEMKLIEASDIEDDKLIKDYFNLS